MNALAARAAEAGTSGPKGVQALFEAEAGLHWRSAPLR